MKKLNDGARDPGIVHVANELELRLKQCEWMAESETAYRSETKIKDLSKWYAERKFFNSLNLSWF